jgi:hypothetical protein
VLKDRTSHWRNLIQALTASIDRTPFNSMVLALRLALLAVRHTVRKTRFSEMLKASIVGRKLAVEVLNCVP